MELYQFRVSPYSEKVRWALEHKNIPYRVHNLVTGLHLFTARRRGWRKTTVPVLSTDAGEIQGSSTIIDYIDRKWTNRPLVPDEPSLQQKADRLEKRLDNLLGRSVRTIFFKSVVDDDEALLGLLSSGRLQPSTVMLRMTLPALKPKIRKGYRLSEEGTRKARERMKTVVEELESELASKPYLLGDRFSRVDIAAASLYAPLIWPDEHPFSARARSILSNAPSTEFTTRPLAQWVRRIYKDHRIAGKQKSPPNTLQ